MGKQSLFVLRSTQNTKIHCVGRYSEYSKTRLHMGLTHLRQYPDRQYRSSPENVTAPWATANEYTSSTLKRQRFDFTNTGHLPVFRQLSANVNETQRNQQCLSMYQVRHFLMHSHDSSQLDK